MKSKPNGCCILDPCTCFWPLRTLLLSELWSVTCHIGSHSITCHRWMCSVLTPAMQAGTQFTYPGGMEGWVYLLDLLFSIIINGVTYSMLRATCFVLSFIDLVDRCIWKSDLCDTTRLLSPRKTWKWTQMVLLESPGKPLSLFSVHPVVLLLEVFSSVDFALFVVAQIKAALWLNIAAELGHIYLHCVFTFVCFCVWLPIFLQYCSEKFGLQRHRCHRSFYCHRWCCSNSWKFLFGDCLQLETPQKNEDSLVEETKLCVTWHGVEWYTFALLS